MNYLSGKLGSLVVIRDPFLLNLTFISQNITLLLNSIYCDSILSRI